MSAILGVIINLLLSLLLNSFLFSLLHPLLPLLSVVPFLISLQNNDIVFNFFGCSDFIQYLGFNQISFCLLFCHSFSDWHELRLCLDKGECKWNYIQNYKRSVETLNNIKCGASTVWQSLILLSSAQLVLWRRHRPFLFE